MYTIDDVITAAQIETWHDHRRSQDCETLCLTWEQIASRYGWAIEVMTLAERNPESIDGMYGEISSHYEDAMDILGV